MNMYIDFGFGFFFSFIIASFVGFVLLSEIKK